MPTPSKKATAGLKLSEQSDKVTSAIFSVLLLLQLNVCPISTHLGWSLDTITSFGNGNADWKQSDFIKLNGQLDD